MEWWREESNHTFFLHLAFMLLHADFFRFCFETITALTSTGAIKLLWGEFLHFDKKEDACEFILLHNDIFSDSAAFFDLLLPVQLMKADTVVRFHHLGETTDIFLSSQWQRSSLACSPSSPHHASKFPPLYILMSSECAFAVSYCGVSAFSLFVPDGCVGKHSRQADEESHSNKKLCTSRSHNSPNVSWASAADWVDGQINGYTKKNLQNHVFTSHAAGLIFLH